MRVLMRIVLRIIAVIAVSVIVAVGIFGWLYTMQPTPRAVEGWLLGPALPAARGELATAVGYTQACPAPPCPEAERLYVLGGLSGFFRPARRVSVYDPNRKVWNAGPSLPAPRHHFAAASLGQALFVSGGTDVAGHHLSHQYWPPRDNLWRLALGSDRWEIAAPMIEPRWGHRMVAHDGRLYVVGGRGPSGRVLIYAPETGWRMGADMPQPRDHLSVVVVDGRIWAIGGRDPRSLARVDIYDPAANSWQPGPDLPATTSGAAEGVLDGTIFIYGGEEPSFFNGGIKDLHWMLDTRAAAQGWRPAPPPPLPVHGTNGAVLQGAFVIPAGASRHGALSVAGWSNVLQLMKPAEAVR